MAKHVVRVDSRLGAFENINRHLVLQIRSLLYSHSQSATLSLNTKFYSIRHFISNPDLPFRIREGIPLTPYDRKKFYDVGSSKRYADYEFSVESQEIIGVRLNAILER